MAEYTIKAELTADKIKKDGGTGSEFLMANGDVTTMSDIEFTYTNDTEMPATVGGLAKGTTFENMSLNDLLGGLLYPYLYPTITEIKCDTTFEYSVAKTLTFTVTGRANQSNTTLHTTKPYIINTTGSDTPNSTSNTYKCTTTSTTTSVTVYAKVMDSNEKISSWSSKKVSAQYRYWIVAANSTPSLTGSTGSLCEGVGSIKKEHIVATTSTNPYVYIITPNSWSFTIKSLGNEFTAYTTTTGTYTPTGGTAQTYKIIKFNNPSVNNTTFTIA